MRKLIPPKMYPFKVRYLLVWDLQYLISTELLTRWYFLFIQSTFPYNRTNSFAKGSTLDCQLFQLDQCKTRNRVLLTNVNSLLRTFWHSYWFESFPSWQSGIKVISKISPFTIYLLVVSFTNNKVDKQIQGTWPCLCPSTGNEHEQVTDPEGA